MTCFAYTPGNTPLVVVLRQDRTLSVIIDVVVTSNQIFFDVIKVTRLDWPCDTFVIWQRALGEKKRGSYASPVARSRVITKRPPTPSSFYQCIHASMHTSRWPKVMQSSVKTSLPYGFPHALSYTFRTCEDRCLPHFYKIYSESMVCMRELLNRPNSRETYLAVVRKFQSY